MTAKPVKSKAKIAEIIAYMEDHNSQRDILIFRFGINSGLRLSDILPLRYNDIYNGDGEFKEYLVLREKKTKREISLVLNKNIRLHMDRYVIARPALKKENGFIFYSSRLPDRPVHKSQVWKVFKKIEYALSLEQFATHSMRKTFGWHLFTLTKDIRTVQRALNHQSPTTTMRYIGVDQVELDRALRKLSLG